MREGGRQYQKKLVQVPVEKPGSAYRADLASQKG